MPLVDTVLRGRRRKTHGRIADAAVQYAAMGWPVCPGTFRPSQALRSADFLRSCSCDRIGCPSPGAHPVSPAWQTLASSNPELVARWWLAMPEANVVLPTGHVFDVLDVPARVGLQALTRMQQSRREPGPVALGVGDRAHFFVRSRGAPADEHEWWSCHLDCEPQEVADVSGLRWHCRDSYVMAPPSRSGTGQVAKWIRNPHCELPDSLWLLEMLADACEEAG